MSNAITKALADTSRSYVAAKASVGQTTEAMLARGPSGGGILGHRPDLARAQEQLRHYRDWPYAAIRAIAQKIAAQPIRVGRIKGKTRLGTKAHLDAEPLDNHPLLDLLADPSDLLTRWAVMFTTVASIQLTGRALWWLPRGKQILPIPTPWITDLVGTTKFTAFQIRPPYTGETYPLPADECCYFSLPHPGDPHGAVSPLQAAAHPVTVDEEIQTSQAAAFANGIHPTHVVLVGKDAHGRRPTLTDAQQRSIITAIRRRYEGTHRAGEPVILDGLIEDVKRLSNTPDEMAWLDSGRTTKERILQTFGVNPIILGQVEGANRASALAAETHFCDFTVNPLIELMSQALTEWLRPQFGDELVIWIEPCVPHDAEMELKRYDLLAKHGVLTADELRAYAGLPQDERFANTLVGGKNMTTSGPIESGLRAMIGDALAGIRADGILESLDRMPAANGRHSR